jgi:L-iditol 2-dehydrogenase
MVMGHEAVGEVIELGPGVKHLKIGDRVAVFNIVGCGTCVFCKEGNDQLCPEKKILGVNAGRWGAMAEYFAFPESGLFTLDPTIDPAIGVLTEPIAVGIHAIGLMQPKRDDVLAIVGAGTIGIGIAIALKARGINRFFSLDKVPEKLDLIRQFGAIPIDVEKEDPNEIIRAATQDIGANGVFEAVGAAPTVRTAYDLCAIGGTLVLIGNLAQEFTLPLQGVTGNETTIKGSYGFTKKDFAEAVAITADRNIPFDTLISGSCTLEEAPEIMTRMANGELQPIKIVIRS